MLVGLVREATKGSVCRWILSGGNQFSSSLTNSSKYLQVRLANRPMKSIWSIVHRIALGLSGMLIHHAMAGDAIHNPIHGKKASMRLRCNANARTATTNASAGAMSMCR